MLKKTKAKSKKVVKKKVTKKVVKKTSKKVLKKTAKTKQPKISKKDLSKKVVEKTPIQNTQFKPSQQNEIIEIKTWPYNISIIPIGIVTIKTITIKIFL